MNVITRPIDPATEQIYVRSTACRARCAALGGKFVDWQHVNARVNEVLDRCVVTVAADEEGDVLGYLARGTDSSVEFFFLRQSLADNGLDPAGRRYREGHGPHGGRTSHWVPRPAAVDVAKVLAGGEAITLRRAPKDWIIDALLRAGVQVSIVPAAV